MLSGAGCAASAPPARTVVSVRQPIRAQPTAAPGELRMRDEVSSSDSRTRALGSLAPVHVYTTEAPARSVRPKVAAPRVPRPIRVARDSVPKRYAVRDGQLLLPSGLIIRGVPNSVSVHSVREQGGGAIWEIVGARGERLALLKAESLSRRFVARSANLDELASARSVGPRSDWGAPRVDVVSERFLSENYLYTIERRAKGTAWIASGLELSARAGTE